MRGDIACVASASIRFSVRAKAFPLVRRVSRPCEGFFRPCEGFSVRAKGLSYVRRSFPPFGCTKVGASKKMTGERGEGRRKPSPSPPPLPPPLAYCSRPNLRAKRPTRSILSPTRIKSNGNACYAGQGRQEETWDLG